MEGFELHGTVKGAIEHAGVSKNLYYCWTDPDISAHYAPGSYDNELCHAIADALEMYNDTIRGEMHRRAVEGVEEPVFGSQGYGEGTGIVGHVTKYSDRLLVELARHRLPEARRPEEDNSNPQAGATSIPEGNFDPKSLTKEQRQHLRAFLEAGGTLPGEPRVIEGEVVKKD